MAPIFQQPAPPHLARAVDERFIKSVVLVPLDGEEPVAEILAPYSSTPAPPLLFFTVILATSELAAVSALFVNAKLSAEVAVLVRLLVPDVLIKLSAPVVNVKPLLAVNV